MALSDELHDLELNEEEQKLRDGIFNMNTRRFGKVAEFMIAKQYGLSLVKGKTNYDLTDENDTAIEVKFSRVEFKEAELKLANCLSVCKENATKQLRRVSCQDVIEGNLKKKFDCNIQQIKAFEFKLIYYGLFFEEQIAIFSMTEQEVKDVMTVQYFVSKMISPKPAIDKTLKMLEADTVEDAAAVYQSLKDIQSGFQYIESTENRYADVAKEYIKNENMKTPWDDLISEIDANGGAIQTQHIERIKEMCRGYLKFCDEEFPVERRMPDASPFQHRGNEKAEGQMHFTDKNFEWHIEKSDHFCGWLSYKDLHKLFEVAE